MKISFHGADQGVTGSCHMVECAGKRILIDCGMYQGGRELVEENAEPMGFDPASIDFLLLTHAHLDHCGRIPLLAKRGFSGEVITTAASLELARLVLLDAAGLQEEEARYQERRAKRRHGKRKNSSNRFIPPWMRSTVSSISVAGPVTMNHCSYRRVSVRPSSMRDISSVLPVFCWSWKKTGDPIGCCFLATWVTAAAQFCVTRHHHRRSTRW